MFIVYGLEYGATNMSKAKRGGKVSAHSSHQSSSRGGGGVEISPTITNMLEELKQLIKKTQVGVVTTDN